MQAFCRRIVGAHWFEPFMIGLIVFNGFIIGLETSKTAMATFGDELHMANHIILGIFILEVIVKLGAVAPQWKKYFGDGWNLFDFSIVALSLLPATGEFALIARLIRILRVLRLISTVPQLRLIVATLVRSIPSMGHVISLLGLVFYIYGVAGYHLFHEIDAERWGTLGASLLTLFQIVTLEAWTEVMGKVDDKVPFAWFYFVSFILIGTFVAMNLFIAVILNSLEDSKAAQVKALRQPVTHDEVLEELRATRDALARLEAKLERMPTDARSG